MVAAPDLNSFEGLVAFAKGAVEFDWQESGDDAEHEMSPFLLAQSKPGDMPQPIVIDDGSMATKAGRALKSAGVQGLVDSMKAKRVAVAVQATMMDEDGSFPGVIVAAFERDKSEFFYAKITEPPSRRVAAWRPSAEGFSEMLTAGLRSALAG